MSEANKKIVQAVNDAFSAGNTEGFLEQCSDDIVWRMIGEKTTTGIEEIREWMSQMEGCEPPVFSVDEIVAEGDSVICRGDMTMKDQEGVEGKYAYCDSYQFKNGKIARLDSYVIKIKEQAEDQKAASV